MGRGNEKKKKSSLSLFFETSIFSNTYKKTLLHKQACAAAAGAGGDLGSAASGV